MEIFQQFRRHLAAGHLVEPGDRLLLAVSGGLDSCVMLDLFCRLRNEWQKHWQLQLAVAHINHQIRGHEANEDEAFVKALAEAAGLPFFSQRVNVPAYARTRKISLETAARELRYHALDHFRESWQARAIVTAHTLDDQAETVLDHLLRGCGLAGLAGMRAETDIILHDSPINNASQVGAFEQKEKLTLPKAVPASSAGPLKGKLQIKILRPLLRFSKAELEDYARRRDLRWREDSSNMELKFRRNRIRYELLPLLKSRFNPQITNALGRLASIAASAEDYFHAEAEARLAEIVKEKQPNKIILDIEQFWKYFPIIRFYVIRRVLRALLGKEVEPASLEISRMLALMQPSDEEKPAGGMQRKRPVTGKRYIWRQQIEVSIDHDGAVFQNLEPNDEERGAESEERKSGLRLTLHASRQTLLVAMSEPCPIPRSGMALLVERKALAPDWRRQVNDHSQFVDAEKVQGSLRVRFPQPGDRFTPLRAGDEAAGSKKLSDFFTDLKVPLHRRHLTPVLECDRGIVWVCGYRIGNRFKITPATQTVLHLQLRRAKNPKNTQD